MPIDTDQLISKLASDVRAQGVANEARTERVEFLADEVARQREDNKDSFSKARTDLDEGLRRLDDKLEHNFDQFSKKIDKVLDKLDSKEDTLSNRIDNVENQANSTATALSTAKATLGAFAGLVVFVTGTFIAIYRS